MGKKDEKGKGLATFDSLFAPKPAGGNVAASGVKKVEVDTHAEKATTITPTPDAVTTGSKPVLPNFTSPFKCKNRGSKNECLADPNNMPCAYMNRTQFSQEESCGLFNPKAAVETIAPQTNKKETKPRQTVKKASPTEEIVVPGEKGCPAGAHNINECNTVLIMPGFMKDAQGVIVPAPKPVKPASKPKPIKEEPRPKRTEPVIDLSEYVAQETGPHVINDGVVYYCRKCKKHFKGPILKKIIPGPVGMITHLKHCPVCDDTPVIDTWNLTTEDKGTCDACGCKLGWVGDEKITDDAICFNCEKGARFDPKYKKGGHAAE